MLSHEGNWERLDSPVIIQDIVVVAPKTEKDKPPPTGEFGTILNLAELMAPENHKKLAQFKLNQEDRLYSTIESLVQHVADRHRQLKARITSLAEKNPENLHLILSSFAVITPDKKVMDVVAHVQCGKNPKLSFIVKNNTADSAPKYSDYSVSTDAKITRKKLFSNVDINDKETKPDLYEMINGVKHHFSYNNIIECMTAGSVPFFTAIDICLDHEFEMAKNNANKLIDNIHESYLRGAPSRFISLLVSYVVTSNYIDVKNKRGLGVITQADPIQSLKECKEQTEKSPPKEIKPSFGQPLISIETSPLQCGEWPQQQRARVIAHNNDVLGIENPKVETKKNKKAVSHSFSDDMLGDLSSDESDEDIKQKTKDTYDMLADLSDDSEQSDEEENHRDDDILEDIITDLKQCEKEHAGQKSQLLSWMTTQGIEPLSLKYKVFLKKELKNVREQLKQILESSRIINKAEQAHKLLSRTLQTITEKDDNLRGTRAFQLCETKMENIEAEYPHLKRNIPTKHF